ncbi:MAG: sulfur carrier protein ThiS [Nitriliruptoraceae bacterium]|nr:sulfur carrier protein ThiS [Nitriliruptoraceae bacterium]
MRITLHGEPLQTEARTVGALVDSRVPDRRGVAVALDGDVVPRARWDDTPLTDGAEVEIVGAVQGG